jgi:hypothetical protein
VTARTLPDVGNTTPYPPAATAGGRPKQAIISAPSAVRQPNATRYPLGRSAPPPRHQHHTHVHAGPAPVKRSQTFRLHPELLRRAEDKAVMEDRTMTSVIEQALAELLAVPVADPAFPPGPVEVCRACRKGVLWRNRCPVRTAGTKRQSRRVRAECCFGLLATVSAVG